MLIFSVEIENKNSKDLIISAVYKVQSSGCLKPSSKKKCQRFNHQINHFFSCWLHQHKFVGLLTQTWDRNL